jgi:branched-chain amino acid transport system substrate-binding protein
MRLGRRSVLAGAAAGFLPLAGRAEAGAPVRIGVLNDQGGVFSDTTGHGSVVSAQFAAADMGGHVAGRPVEIMFADHQNKPDVGAAIARDWFDRGGVDAIADLGNSAVALAVAGIAHEKNKAVLISAGGTTALTGAQCAPTTVQWTYDTWSNATTLARTMMQQGEDTWFFITADYTFGHNLQNEATATIVKSGGKVLGSAAHPLNTQDFSAFLLQAQASGAKVIGLANGGDDTGRSVKQAREFGLKQRMAGLSALITDVHGLGLPTAQGLYLTETFYWNLNDKTRAFSDRWAKPMGGRMPCMMQAGVYSVVLHYLEAVAALGRSDDGAAVVARMKAQPYDDPLFGRCSIRADGRALHDAYTFRAKAPAESHGPWDVYDTVATLTGEETVRPLADGGCAFVRS